MKTRKFYTLLTVIALSFWLVFSIPTVLSSPNSMTNSENSFSELVDCNENPCHTSMSTQSCADQCDNHSSIVAEQYLYVAQQHFIHIIYKTSSDLLNFSIFNIFKPPIVNK